MACILRRDLGSGQIGHAATVSRTVKVLLLVNSSASSVTARGRVVIQKALSADHDVTLAETSRRGHATRLAQGAAADGADVVVVLGGDGTLNEAANGLAGTDTALAALPGGSTNVFARTIGLPDDPIEATGVLLEALARGAIRRVGLGLGQRALLPVPRRHGLRRRRRRPGRAAGRAQALRQPPAVRLRRLRDVVPPLRPQPAPASRCTSPTATVVDDGYFAICLNTNPYTYLGHPPAQPRARAPTSTPAWPWCRSARSTSRPSSASACSALASGDHLRNSRAGRLPHRPRRAHASRATARSPTRSTATTSARSTTPRVPPRARRLSLVTP